MRRIVFLDVDGTLVRDDQTISPATVQACRKARENGHKLFLCTGRSRAVLFDNIVDLMDIFVQEVAMRLQMGRFCFTIKSV